MGVRRRREGTKGRWTREKGKKFANQGRFQLSVCVCVSQTVSSVSRQGSARLRRGEVRVGEIGHSGQCIGDAVCESVRAECQFRRSSTSSSQPSSVQQFRRARATTAHGPCSIGFFFALSYRCGVRPQRYDAIPSQTPRASKLLLLLIPKSMPNRIRSYRAISHPETNNRSKLAVKQPPGRVRILLVAETDSDACRRPLQSAHAWPARRFLRVRRRAQ